MMTYDESVKATTARVIELIDEQSCDGQASACVICYGWRDNHAGFSDSRFSGEARVLSPLAAVCCPADRAGDHQCAGRRARVPVV